MCIYIVADENFNFEMNPKKYSTYDSKALITKYARVFSKELALKNLFPKAEKKRKFHNILINFY
jgi:hypothetical protein